MRNLIMIQTKLTTCDYVGQFSKMRPFKVEEYTLKFLKMIGVHINNIDIDTHMTCKSLTDSAKSNIIETVNVDIPYTMAIKLYTRRDEDVYYQIFLTFDSIFDMKVRISYKETFSFLFEYDGEITSLVNEHLKSIILKINDDIS